MFRITQKTDPFKMRKTLIYTNFYKHHTTGKLRRYVDAMLKIFAISAYFSFDYRTIAVIMALVLQLCTAKER